MKTNEQKRGFVISWFYPPGNSSEGLVTYKLLKNSQYAYDVFTRGVQNATIWDRKVDESKLTADNVTVIMSKSKNPRQWIDEAVEYFLQNSDKYDFIMSRIMGVEAHEVALRIKKARPDVKWIASFGDPLVDSPYIRIRDKQDNPHLLSKYVERESPSLPRMLKISVSPVRHAKKYVWNRERRGEKAGAGQLKKVNDETFRLADVLIFNNKYQYERAFWNGMKKYKSKGIIVNHSFDLDLYPKTKKKDSKKLRFCYVGHLDTMRNASALFDALGMLAKHDPELHKKVAFNFFGHMSDMDKSKIIDNGIAKMVSVHKDIDYLESLKEISESDWLILIDANLNKELDEYIFFPAKLADYLAVKKNILAITQLKGATADIVRETRCGQIVTHSADDIAIYLSKIIYQGYSPANYNDDEWKKYDARNVAKEYDKTVQKLLEGKWH
ncbi:hypothetical protein IJJ54_02240 [Candidatus Saccharibacteria bacterium]|nr:hypothetical protein [Candidatus Saccharibacteria bacterium]